MWRIAGIVCKAVGWFIHRIDIAMLGHYLMGSGNPVRLDFVSRRQFRVTFFGRKRTLKDYLYGNWFENWQSTKMKNAVGKVLTVNVGDDELDWVDVYQFYPTCGQVGSHVAGCSCLPKDKMWNEVTLCVFDFIPNKIRPRLYRWLGDCGWCGPPKNRVKRIVYTVLEFDRTYRLFEDLKIEVCAGTVVVEAKDRFFEDKGVPFFMHGNAKFIREVRKDEQFEAVINKRFHIRWTYKPLDYGE